MHLNIDRDCDAGLELAARLCGYTWGSRGNVREMVHAVGRGELFPVPLDWKGLDRAIECDALIQQKQPFKLNYKDAQGVERLFSVRFAEIAYHEKRFYLDCWASETEDNSDLPELRHNWCFRFDRVVDIQPELSLAWLNGLDSTLVTFRLYGGMVKAYERRESDIQVESSGDSLTVTRRIGNSFWFVRSILPYGANCEVLAPDEIRVKVAAEFKAAAARYEV